MIGRKKFGQNLSFADNAIKCKVSSLLESAEEEMQDFKVDQKDSSRICRQLAILQDNEMTTQTTLSLPHLLCAGTHEAARA
uniref:Uncharacterized protein n=1 Tax=Vespula pensylvanica TaxID=30213 RepID=A0A834MYG7_VESPE|nr:hypothetical protein H0235_018340 [Vespula pensylvanica]